MASSSARCSPRSAGRAASPEHHPRSTSSALSQWSQQRNRLLQPAELIKPCPSPAFCCPYRGRRDHGALTNQVTFKASSLPRFPEAQPLQFKSHGGVGFRGLLGADLAPTFPYLEELCPL